MQKIFTEKKIQTVLTFLYSVSYKIHASQFWQLVCKSISIGSILCNVLTKEEGP